MTVKNLFKFLIDITRRNRKITELNLKHQTIAIDISTYIKKCIHISILESVSYCCNLLIILIQEGIIPFVVFDGKAPIEKHQQMSRNQVRDIPSPQPYEEINKQLEIKLKEMHIQYVFSLGETDAQIACLERLGVVGGVLSEDSDMIAYGVRHLYCKLDLAKMTVDHISFEEIKGHPAVIRNDFPFTYTNWLIFCLLLGTDYCEKPKGLGCEKTIKKVGDALKQKMTLSAFMDNLFNDQQKKKVFLRALKIFLYPTVRNGDSLITLPQKYFESSPNISTFTVTYDLLNHLIKEINEPLKDTESILLPNSKKIKKFARKI